MKKLYAFLIAVIILGITYGIVLTKKSTPTIEPTITKVSYRCTENKTIDASFYEPNTPLKQTKDGQPIPTGSVSLILSDGRTMTLNQTISGSGVRYANKDESFVFWSKGTGALILENNKEGVYKNCVDTSTLTAATPSQEYINTSLGFSLRIPKYSTSQVDKDSYTLNESYTYGLIPGETITGVSFTLPSSYSTGTNLSNDSYLSVETIKNAKNCTGDMFLEGNHTTSLKKDGTLTYSVASTSDAGAGNRYEETVYAVQGRSKCIAVRYFIHYGAFENYPTGTTKEWNRTSVISSLDTIRTSLILK